jgi:hypothetical protein
MGVNLRIAKKCGGKSAGELLELAKVGETQSGDFYVFVGDLTLDITEDYWMVVSGGGYGLCQMEITENECGKLEDLQAQVEEKYEAKLIGCGCGE